MIKTDLVRVSQENYNRKKADRNAMEYSKHIERKNMCKAIIIILVAIVWLLLVGLFGSAELGLL